MEQELKNLKELCNEHSADYEKAVKFKDKHKKYTNNQVIQHYKPWLVENIFGELIEIQ